MLVYDYPDRDVHKLLYVQSQFVSSPYIASHSLADSLRSTSLDSVSQTLT